MILVHSMYYLNLINNENIFCFCSLFARFYEGVVASYDSGKKKHKVGAKVRLSILLLLVCFRNLNFASHICSM